MIIAQISIAPIGKDASLSNYVKKAVEILRNETNRCDINAMATVVEIDTLEQLFSAVTHAHTAVLQIPGVKRVITEIKIDDRRDKNATIDDKINAASL
jgi:uncharacterized protein (TIGR00106 family)